MCERAGQTVCYSSTPRALCRDSTLTRGTFTPRSHPSADAVVRALSSQTADASSDAASDTATIPATNATPGTLVDDDGDVMAVGVYGGELTCYLCSETGHGVSTCPKFRELRNDPNKMRVLRAAFRDPSHVRELAALTDADLLGLEDYSHELLGADF